MKLIGNCQPFVMLCYVTSDVPVDVDGTDLIMTFFEGGAGKRHGRADLFAVPENAVVAMARIGDCFPAQNAVLMRDDLRRDRTGTALRNARRPVRQHVVVPLRRGDHRPPFGRDHRQLSRRVEKRGEGQGERQIVRSPELELQIDSDAHSASRHGSREKHQVVLPRRAYRIDPGCHDRRHACSRQASENEIRGVRPSVKV